MKERQPGAPSAARDAGVSGVSRVAVLAVSALFSVLTARTIIESAGPTVFAFVTLVLSVSSMLSFSDFGAGAALTNAIASSRYASRDEEVLGTLKACLKVTIVGGSIAFLFAAALASTSVWPRILGNVADQPPALAVAAFVTISVLVLSAPLGLAQRILLGAGRNHVVILCQGVAAPISLAVASLIAKSSLDLGWFAICYAIGQVVSLILMDAAAWIVTGVSAVRGMVMFRRSGSAPGLSIRGTAGPMFLITLALPLALQSHRLMLSHFSTTEAVGEYSVAAQLYSPLWAVVAAGGTTLWPRFTRDRRDKSNSRPLWVRSVWILAAAGVFGGVFLMVFGSMGAAIISANQIHVSLPVLVAFALLLLVQALHLPSGMLLMDSSGLRLQAVTTATMLVVSLGLGVLGTRAVSTSGPVLATVLAILVCHAAPCAWVAYRRTSTTVAVQLGAEHSTKMVRP